MVADVEEAEGVVTTETLGDDIESFLQCGKMNNSVKKVILTIDNCKGFPTEDLVEACDAASNVQLIMAGDSLREKHAFPVALGLVNAPTDQVTRQQLRSVQRELVTKGMCVQNISFDGASRGLAYNVCPCLPTDVCSCSAEKFKPVFVLSAYPEQ